MARIALLDPMQTGREAEALEDKLRHFIVGQEEAIHEIVRAYQTHLSGLFSGWAARSETSCSLGPTGSGKTRIVEATAESLLRNSRAVIKIDCARSFNTAMRSREVDRLATGIPGTPRNACSAVAGNVGSVSYGEAKA